MPIISNLFFYSKVYRLSYFYTGTYSKTWQRTQPLVAIGNEMYLLLGTLRQPSIYLALNHLKVLGVASVFVFGMLLFYERLYYMQGIETKIMT